MIHKFPYTFNDKKILEYLNYDSNNLINDNHDYSDEIVQKPWGYEYQILNNNNIAIWILHINGGQSTSLHCHPNKQTVLTLLDGEKAICIGLITLKELHKGDTVLIDKATFHQTLATIYKPIIIMEIETPVNKNDLVRYVDSYGRVGD